MKIGIASSAYIDPYGYEKGLEKLKRHGYDCIDYNCKINPNFVDTGNGLFAVSEAEFEKRLRGERELFRNSGIFVNQTHGPWRHPKDGSCEERAERFEKMCRSIRGTAYLGCENMVIHPLMPFGARSAEAPAIQWEINLEFMSRLAEFGKEYGVTVCIENMPFRELPLAPVSEVLRMAKAVNSDYFKVCLDTGHASAIGDSPADAVRLLGKDYLRVMHVHDNDGKEDRHWLPGTGVINWDDFSEALFDIKYEGALVLETGISRFAKAGEDIDEREAELACFARKLAKKE